MMFDMALIALGGALGALARYISVYWIHQMFSRSFPFGTLFVNSLGSFLIGLAMSLIFERLSINAESWRLFIVIGFLGAYTTFSSFSWEMYQFMNQGLWGSALTHLFLNNIITVLMVVIGLKTGRLLGAG